MRKHAIIIDPNLGQAKQSFKDECDINKIMEKFQKSGAITHFTKNAPIYGDHSSAELFEAQLVVANAETMFAELPSSIRKKFDNNPGQFLEFVQNPANEKAMQELGLAKKPVIDETAVPGATVERNAPASAESKTDGENQGDGQKTPKTE